MTKKILVLLGSGLVLAATLFGFQALIRLDRRTHAGPPTQAMPEPPDLTALTSEVQALRGEVRAADARAQLLQASLHDAPPTQADPVSEAIGQADSEVAREEAEVHREQYIGAIGRSFESEIVDRAWSPAVTAQLQQTLTAEDVKLTPKSLECRTSACKVELDNQDPGLQKGLPLLVNRMGGPLPNTIAHQVPDDHGGTKTVIYLFRAGLPPDPEAG